MFEFKTFSKSITQCPVDVIVNSIGIDGNCEGAICQAVLKACKDSYPHLEDFIRVKNADHGEMFITKSGLPSLPESEVVAKHIIHYVVPRKNHDIAETDLHYGLVALVEFAIKNGFKSIAIPKIGTGYNTYNDQVFLDAYGRMKEHFKKDKRDFTVYKVEYSPVIPLVKPLLDVTEVELNIHDKKIYYIDGRGTQKSRSIDQTTSKVQMVINFYNSFMLDRTYPLKKPVNKPFDFVEQFVEGKSDNDLLSDLKRTLNECEGLLGDTELLTRNDLWKIKKSKTISLPYLVILSNMLKLGRDDFIQFLIVSGLSLVPDDELSMVLIKYWKNHPFMEEENELIKFCLKNLSKNNFQDYFYIKVKKKKLTQK